MKRFLCMVLAVCTILSVLCGFSFTASAATTELAETGADYGLMKNIQGSAILHCFNWKYNDIKAELKSIAEAGFTAVQTSPAQPANSGCWWWLYQPWGFYVGNNSLGSKSDLQALCKEADKYGVKVVVDVVANHLASDHSKISNELRDGQYWHSHGGNIDYSNRWQIHQGEIGMPDLNSEHSFVQQKVADYVKELASIGVDGIRWDAAKHIAVPNENDQHCQFWPKVTGAVSGMWHYGEILDDPVANNGSLAESLMKEYSNYISVTDSGYCGDVRMSFRSGQVTSSIGNYASRGVAKNKIVYWAESHDTYSNNNPDGRYDSSQFIDQNKIDRAYAVIASQNGVSALYFSRPGSNNKDSIMAGQKGSTNFKKPEVAAVNKLKNACDGEKESMTTADNVAVVCRESGAAVVLGSGGGRNVTVPNAGGTTKPGTYKDLVSGSTWTVTSSQMSGQVGSSGIAVLLNATPKVEGPSAFVTPDSTNYTTDTFEVTLNFSNATSGQYSVNGGAYQSFTNGQKITVGKGTAAGTQTTISVKASNGTNTSEAETYEYNLSVSAEPGIYYDNSSTNWSSVNCYIYKNGQGYTQWPGEKMTKVSDNIYYYKVPAGYDDCQVIFSDNGNNQYPADEGLKYSGKAMICVDEDWKEHTVIDDSLVTPTQPTTQDTVATTPTQAPVTQVPVTKPQPTQPPVTVPTTAKTEPTENDVIVVPPTPQPLETTPTPTKPNLTAGDKYLYGDVDLNGKISIKDATIVQKACSRLSSLSTIQLIVSDVNKDTKVNVKDGTTIQKFCANLVTSFDSGVWYVVPDATAEPTEAPETKPQTTQASTTVPQPTQTPVTKPTQVVTDPTEAPVTMPTEAPTIPTEAPAVPTEAPVNPTPEGMITVYFKNDYKWSNVKAHYWNADGSKSTDWPGESMTPVSGDYYSITISDDNVHIIFSDDGNYQTDDLSVPGVNKYYSTDTNQWHDYTGENSNNSNNNNNNANNGNYIYFRDTDNWNCTYAHTWGNGETTWPGTRMDYVEGNLFRLEVPAGHTQVVFNDGNDNRKTGDVNIEIGKVYNYSTGQWETL